MKLNGVKNERKQVVGDVVSDEAGLGLVRAVFDVVAHGAGVSLFRTRNGSAVGYRIMWGDINEVEYVADWQTMAKALADVAEQMREMEEPPMVKKDKPKRIQMRSEAPPKDF